MVSLTCIYFVEDVKSINVMEQQYSFMPSIYTTFKVSEYSKFIIYSVI
jgi:hypothetical protein